MLIYDIKPIPYKNFGKKMKYKDGNTEAQRIIDLREIKHDKAVKEYNKMLEKYPGPKYTINYTL